MKRRVKTEERRRKKEITTKNTKDTKVHKEKPEAAPFVIPSLRGT
jgi:hypothetical protein